AIANYVVGSGINTYLGIIPQVLGGPNFVKLMTEDVQEFIGAHFVFEKDPLVMVDKIMVDLEAKRVGLGI
ncbi:MAG: carbon monoxide dehydrogenase, partial [Acetobacterium sp.]|nr:carbon monoxide dehydrogenase [Acetobacterium sp.]